MFAVSWFYLWNSLESWSRTSGQCPRCCVNRLSAISELYIQFIVNIFHCVRWGRTHSNRVIACGLRLDAKLRWSVFVWLCARKMPRSNAVVMALWLMHTMDGSTFLVSFGFFSLYASFWRSVKVVSLLCINTSLDNFYRNNCKSTNYEQTMVSMRSIGTTY